MVTIRHSMHASEYIPRGLCGPRPLASSFARAGQVYCRRAARGEREYRGHRVVPGALGARFPGAEPRGSRLREGHFVLGIGEELNALLVFDLVHKL